MLKIACFALLALAAQLQGSNAFFSSESANLRMTGGDVVQDSGTYSYQVAIQPSLSQAVPVALNVCSGVLIKGLAPDANGVFVTAYYILTSATCVLSGTTYTVWVGTNEVRATTRPAATIIRSATNTIIHPEFLTSGMTSSDIAILTATADITALINNPTASMRPTAALLTSVNDAGKGYLASSVSMAGWGFPNDVFNAASPKLRQLKARVVPNFYCAAINFGKPITNKHLCTGGLFNKGPCTGDSGAPLILQGSNGAGSRVIGLATLVPSSGCSKGKPGVFTHLGKYLAWIVTVTNYDAEQ